MLQSLWTLIPAFVILCAASSFSSLPGNIPFLLKNQKYILPYIFLENILLSPTKVLPTAKTIRSKSRTRLRMHPSMVSSNLQKRLRKGCTPRASPARACISMCLFHPLAYFPHPHLRTKATKSLWGSICKFKFAKGH
jgi:hypothetical protein